VKPLGIWSQSHRLVLIALLAILLVYLSIRLLLNPVYVADPQPLEPQRAAEVQDRIDPNAADAHTLAALPLIGEKRGEEIVAYRAQFLAEHPGEIAFKVPDDLRRIRGIGTATLTQLEPYLIFPPQAPSTTQAAP
jgi:DNA uptake protein ComE-like DNA-binding protein